MTRTRVMNRLFGGLAGVLLLLYDLGWDVSAAPFWGRFVIAVGFVLVVLALVPHRRAEPLLAFTSGFLIPLVRFVREQPQLPGPTPVSEWLLWLVVVLLFAQLGAYLLNSRRPERDERGPSAPDA